MRSLGLLVLAASLAALPAATGVAQPRHGGGGYHPHYAPAPQWHGGHGYNYGGAIAGGALLGFGLGALLGGALLAPPPVVYAPPPQYYYYYNGPPPYYVMPYAPPPPVYYGY